MSGKRVLRSIGIGMLIGLAIGVGCEQFFSALLSESYIPGKLTYLESFGSIHLAILIERILYMVLGAVMGGAALIFEIESFSLGKATVIHMLVLMGSLLSIGFYLQWFLNGWELLGFLLTSLLIYFIIWVVSWGYNWWQVKQINRKLASDCS